MDIMALSANTNAAVTVYIERSVTSGRGIVTVAANLDLWALIVLEVGIFEILFALSYKLFM